MKHEIKVFLGGGVTLLEGCKTNRGYRPSVVDPAISKLNSKRNSQRIYIVKTFTDLIHEYTPEGQQEHYHRFLEQEADIALFIFDGRIGDKTKEEIERACDSFTRHQHPHVFFYGTNLTKENEILSYLASKNQYFQNFKNKEHLFHLIQEDLSSWVKQSLWVRWWHRTKSWIIPIVGCLLVGLIALLLLKQCSDTYFVKPSDAISNRNDYESAEGSIEAAPLQSTKNTLHKSQVKPPKQSKNNIITFTLRDVSFDMVYIHGDTFTMGATAEQESDAECNETPIHIVSLSDYYMGKYEVTQELWQEVMGNNPSYFKCDSNPVEEISWDDCQIFITNLNKLLASQLGDKHFALPTEAQWEYAARGGNQSKRYKYSGSNDIDDVAWYVTNSNKKTHSVGTKYPNELGLYDMSGNVKEWCQDWYNDYTNETQEDPTGPTFASNRVYRGGCWRDRANHCRVSSRASHYSPSFHYNFLGLRLCLHP